LEHHNATQKDGNVVQSLRDSLQERSPGRRNARIELMAKRLAEATCSKEKGNRAFKISIRYQIPLNKSILHLGGLHALTTNGTPHLYTTSGVVGDHEGPRCWILSQFRLSNIALRTTSARDGTCVTVLASGWEDGLYNALAIRGMIMDVARKPVSMWPCCRQWLRSRNNTATAVPRFHPTLPRINVPVH
jgi:hypothetical protein